jgi:hypothetical protein
MYKIIEWNTDLDLTEFYRTASEKGFVNNSSQKTMIDCFRNEREMRAWILYQNDKAVGSVVAHTFDDIMGEKSYRVLARTCTFGTARPNAGLITPQRLIAEHQNLTDQFLLPACISWTGVENIYATSNDSKIASQRLVHRYYFPTLEKLGIVKKVKDIHYRHTDQTLWKIHGDRFLENLKRYPRWI